MTKDKVRSTEEALKLALEALEDLGMKYFESTGEVLYKETFTAIKEALAQPEQEYDWKDLYEKEKRKSAMWLAKYEELAGPAPKAIPMAQPEQEPVACIEYVPCCTDQTCPKCKATTPPQRTWVGLTEDEAFACQGRDYFETYKAIEAKLKERNT